MAFPLFSSATHASLYNMIYEYLKLHPNTINFSLKTYLITKYYEKENVTCITPNIFSVELTVPDL